MSIEKLKEQARRHEQKEEWRKALDQYKKAIDRLAEEDQPDIGLYNRVGDLYVRVGNLDEAVEHYEKAVDLYVEAELPNNAIAVCKKVIRNVPDRHQIYLKMGQIRANQGFMSDARTNFLTYAERAAQNGDLDESLRALAEFADLAPDDVELRTFVGEQMASHDRPREAVEQLSLAYRAARMSGDEEKSEAIEARIQELDPEADLSGIPLGGGAFAGTSSVGDDGEIVAQFGEIEFGSGAAGAREAMADAAEEQAGVGADAEDEEGFELPLLGARGDADETAGEDAPPLAGPDDGADQDDGGFSIATPPAGDDEEGSGPPMTSGDGEDDGDFELPTFETGDEDDDEDVELPTFEIPDDDEEIAPVEVDPDDPAEAHVPGVAAAEERAEALEEAVGGREPSAEDLRRRIAEAPDDVSLHQRLVEVSYRAGESGRLADAYVGLAGALERTGDADGARNAWEQALEADPQNPAARSALGRDQAPAAAAGGAGDYVDLGAMILGGGDEEKSTRFRVAYEEPSGDEEADFAKMLAQFKEQVSANLDADDVKSHYDLGTAYKEMGLLDEAVAEFQQALRASSRHLPTYEMLGQTFLEMAQPEHAVRSLQRALQVPYEVEDELVGIYYYLARAHEELGKTDEALEFYDRVFSLDINFADVTERLRALR